MGQVSTLIEIVESLDLLDVDMTIYAQSPWTVNSAAIVALPPDRGGRPEMVEKLGFEYFLEVDLAREFLADWLSSISIHPNALMSCERLIGYATNDA